MPCSTPGPCVVQELEGFAGIVAHDLRNPVAAVMSWAEIVDEALDGLDVAAAHRGVLRIFGTAERAMGQISDLLAFSRAGNQPLREEVFDLGPVVQSVLEEIQPGCPDLQVEVEELGLARGDAALVQHLVANVIGNAVKYVAPGVSPRLRVTSCTTEGFRTVDVEDNGVGIPAEHRSRVFESFYRAPTPGAYPGTGLGLAICARVVERHGGQISAGAARTSGGTTIRFSLPAA